MKRGSGGLYAMCDVFDDSVSISMNLRLLRLAAASILFCKYVVADETFDIICVHV